MKQNGASLVLTQLYSMRLGRRGNFQRISFFGIPLLQPPNGSCTGKFQGSLIHQSLCNVSLHCNLIYKTSVPLKDGISALFHYQFRRLGWTIYVTLGFSIL